MRVRLWGGARDGSWIEVSGDRELPGVMIYNTPAAPELMALYVLTDDDEGLRYRFAGVSNLDDFQRLAAATRW